MNRLPSLNPSPLVFHKLYEPLQAFRCVLNPQKVSLCFKIIIDIPGLFFDMYSMGACTTRKWKTSGQFVQELNECTVATSGSMLNFD